MELVWEHWLEVAVRDSKVPDNWVVRHCRLKDTDPRNPKLLGQYSHLLDTDPCILEDLWHQDPYNLGKLARNCQDTLELVIHQLHKFHQMLANSTAQHTSIQLFLLHKDTRSRNWRVRWTGYTVLDIHPV